MSGHNNPATIGTVLPVLIGYTAIGKALVKKGVLLRQDIIDELMSFQTTTTDRALIAEIDNIILTVRSW